MGAATEVVYAAGYDGVCTDDEAAVAEAVGVAPESADNAVPEKINALFASYDANGDGVISDEELTSSLEKGATEPFPAVVVRSHFLPCAGSFSGHAGLGT